MRTIATLLLVLHSVTAAASFGPFDLSLLKIKSKNINRPVVLAGVDGDIRSIGVMKGAPVVVGNVPGGTIKHSVSQDPYILAKPLNDSFLASNPKMVAKSLVCESDYRVFEQLADSFMRAEQPVDLDSLVGDRSLDAPSRKRFRFIKTPEKIVPEMTLKQVIDWQYFMSKFNNVLSGQVLVETLELIVKNDRDAFYAGEKQFIRCFRKPYNQYSRDNTEYYLFKYLFLLGADTLINPGANHQTLMITEKKYDMENSMRYVLHNFPIEKIIKLFTSDMCLMPIERKLLLRIKEMILQKYPDLPYFKRLFVDLIGIGKDIKAFKYLFLEPDEKKALFKIVSLFKKVDFENCNSSFRSLIIRIIIDFRHYFPEFDASTQFHVAEVFLLADNAEGLTQLIESDQKFLFHFEPNSDADDVYKRNILTSAMQKRAYNCIHLLLELFPELAPVSEENMLCALEYAILLNSGELMAVFEKFGFTYNYVIKNSQMTMLQLAVYHKSIFHLKRYIKAVGIEKVHEQVLAKWPTAEIVLTADDRDF